MIKYTTKTTSKHKKIKKQRQCAGWEKRLTSFPIAS
jgi:hypothetical protein